MPLLGILWGGQHLFFGFSMPPLGEGQEGGVTHREAEAKPDTGDTDLYRQLFTYLELLEDPVRLRSLGTEAKPDAGDSALYRQLSTYPL